MTDPIARLRAVTDDDVVAALNGSCVADLSHRVEPAELVEFVRCLANRLFGVAEALHNEPRAGDDWAASFDHPD